MKDHSHLNVNRPVHLARRDAYYEYAVELLNRPMHGMDLRERIRHAERAAALFKTASQHARFASRSPQAGPNERDFLRFLQLIIDQVESLLAMNQQQTHFVLEECFLGRFLQAQPEQLQLLPGHYQRRAEDIQDGLCHLLQLAYPPHHELYEANLQSLNESERVRYSQAYACFREDLTRSDLEQVKSVQTSG
ncbi:MAG: hypothetical protein EPN23_09730 [Verrucomicrobia bacterium]|nr:MAG: hypothetical protein EPN23_09730 [Verrucomicrobiota bacterium]